MSNKPFAKPEGGEPKGRTKVTSLEPKIETLLIEMQDTNPKVRAQATSLLDHFADDRCVDPLRRALTDPSPLARRHAVHSIGCQQCKLKPLEVDIVRLLVERALHDKSLRVRRVAVHQLGLQAQDARAVAALDRKLSFRRRTRGNSGVGAGVTGGGKR